MTSNDKPRRRIGPWKLDVSAVLLDKQSEPEFIALRDRLQAISVTKGGSGHSPLMKALTSGFALVGALTMTTTSSYITYDANRNDFNRYAVAVKLGRAG